MTIFLAGTIGPSHKIGFREVIFYQILKAIGFIMGFDFEGDTVIINKPPTPSQQRFLISR
jgi:hypothetical protein